MSKAKKKSPIKAVRVSFTLTGFQASALYELVEKLQSHPEHMHRTWSPSEAAREGLALLMQEHA